MVFFMIQTLMHPVGLVDAWSTLLLYFIDKCFYCKDQWNIRNCVLFYQYMLGHRRRCNGNTDSILSFQIPMNLNVKVLSRIQQRNITSNKTLMLGSRVLQLHWRISALFTTPQMCPTLDGSKT